MAAPTRLADRVRTHLREAMSARKISQRKMAKLLHKHTGTPWNQMDVARILKGSVKLKVDDVEVFAAVLGVSVVEWIREPGREYVGNLLPSEMQLLNALRDDPRYMPVLLDMMRLKATPPTPPKREYRRVSKAEFWAPEKPPKPPKADDVAFGD